jgi:hypothetical protein
MTHEIIVSKNKVKGLVFNGVRKHIYIALELMFIHNLYV